MTQISVVFTGPECKEISITKSVKNVRRYFKNCEVILSTNDLDFANSIRSMDIFDRIIEIATPVDSLPGIKFSDNKKDNNINKQIQTAFNGIKAAKNDIVLRIRTDHAINSDKIMEFWRLSEKKACKSPHVQGRIITSSLFSINPRYLEKMAWHISDMIQLGYKKDLMTYFSAPYYSREYATWYENNPHNKYANWYELNYRSKFAVEQWLTLHYIFKKETDFPIANSHQISKTIIEEFESTWPLYFFIVHPFDIKLVSPKFSSSIGYCNTQCYTTYDNFNFLNTLKNIEKPLINKLDLWRPSFIDRLIRLVLKIVPDNTIKKILENDLLKKIRNFLIS